MKCFMNIMGNNRLDLAVWARVYYTHKKVGNVQFLETAIFFRYKKTEEEFVSHLQEEN